MKENDIKSLKEIFSKYIIDTRIHHLGISQEKMAELLRISHRGYYKLETKKSCCSGLTLAIFLALYCSDPSAFLMELRKAFEEND